MLFGNMVTKFGILHNQILLFFFKLCKKRLKILSFVKEMPLFAQISNLNG
jgi:hypothetical protein